MTEQKVSGQVRELERLARQLTALGRIVEPPALWTLGAFPETRVAGGVAWSNNLRPYVSILHVPDVFRVMSFACGIESLAGVTGCNISFALYSLEDNGRGNPELRLVTVSDVVGVTGVGLQKGRVNRVNGVRIQPGLYAVAFNLTTAAGTPTLMTSSAVVSVSGSSVKRFGAGLPALTSWPAAWNWNSASTSNRSFILGLLSPLGHELVS